MTYYYLPTMEVDDPAYLDRSALRPAPTLDDARRRGVAALKRADPYYDWAVIFRAKEVSRDACVGIVQNLPEVKVDSKGRKTVIDVQVYYPAKSRQGYRINKDGSLGGKFR